MLVSPIRSNQTVAASEELSQAGSVMRRRRRTLLTLLGECLVLLLMVTAGVVRASLMSLAYFVCFLGALTSISMGRPLARAYRYVTRRGTRCKFSFASKVKQDLIF